MVLGPFWTFAEQILILDFGQAFCPPKRNTFLDLWPSGGPSGPREYFIDIRAENPVQSEPEMLDLVPYGPPW